MGPQSGSALELLLPLTSTYGIGGKLAARAIPLQWRFAEDLNATPESTSMIATPTFSLERNFIPYTQRESEKKKKTFR